MTGSPFGRVASSLRFPSIRPLITIPDDRGSKWIAVPERQGLHDARENPGRRVLVFSRLAFHLFVALRQCGHKRDRRPLGVGGWLGLERRRDRDRDLDLPRRGHRVLDGDAEVGAQLLVVDRAGRVGNHDEHRSIREIRDGESRMTPDELNWKQRCRSRVDVVLGQLDERQLVLLGERAADIVFAQSPASDQDLAESSRAREPLLGKRGIELVLGHKPVAKEERSQDGPSFAVLYFQRSGVGERFVWRPELDDAVVVELLRVNRLRVVDLGQTQRYLLGRLDRPSHANTEDATDGVQTRKPARVGHRDEQRAVRERRMGSAEQRRASSTGSLVASGPYESDSSRSTKGSSCCSATSLATCVVVTTPRSTSASPSR